MDAFPVSWATALWLGILTSLSPCPLAANVTAVAYIGRLVGHPRHVLWAGLLYTIGRALAYLMLCAVVVFGLLSIPGVSFFLQRRMGQLLGPLLVLTGLFLVFAERFSFSGGGRFSALVQRCVDRGGLWGAAPMGFLFALSLCPVSAALFFGSLIPLAVKHNSIALLPTVYGAGTAIPAVVVAVALAFGGGALGKAYNRLSGIERWARWATAGIFILAGAYMAITTIRNGP
ncbi:MAG TPA: aromatic aminobenezylarsenical efflux permease ArsG family transporter [Elusimicrobiota bacterium]|nr:aromatic aminobenezylarsenical efflux permease ArsG family transporter [Elusimicrobiota bacterium]